ncbi:MAG: Gfo/Idh/MocA family oxidoreductase [Flavobacteriaceae bacterium]
MATKKSKHDSPLSRRAFIEKTAAASLFTIVPSHTISSLGHGSPNDMINLAAIGVGNRGGQVIGNIATPDVQTTRGRSVGYFRQPYAGIKPEPRTFNRQAQGESEKFKHANIYAICDVDHDYAGHVIKGYPKAKTFHDYREMIDNEKEIDGVVIATPDHTHAVIASYAMKAGRHVYVEKPMTKTIYEARFLRDLAKQTGVVTQVGNQGHNVEGTLETVEYIKSGVIGNVSEVHLWSNRPIWKQGYHERPAGVSVPEHLNYDLWLGPAPYKDYHPDILHFAWRGLWDYGTGAMGDMGAHTFDAPLWALDLGMPTKIQATTTPFNENYLPQSERVTYHFEGHNGKPPVTVTWSDGGIKPSRPEALEANRGLREALYIGDKGMMMHGTHGASPELIPNNPDFAPKKELPRPSNIYLDFIEAIKEKRQAANNFEIAAKVTEVMLLTNIAVAAQQLDITLEYDAENMRITNCEEANNYFHYEYRKGWSL